MNALLICGANGYSGHQILASAVSRGLKPIAAGRNAKQVAVLDKEFGPEHRCFDLGDTAAVDNGLKGVRVLLHCAGPFSAASRPMLDACIRAGAHYLDITGEYKIFEANGIRTAKPPSSWRWPLTPMAGNAAATCKPKKAIPLLILRLSRLPGACWPATILFSTLKARSGGALIDRFTRKPAVTMYQVPVQSG